MDAPICQRLLIERYGGDKQAIIDQTFKYPEVLDRYRAKMAQKPFLPLSHEDLADIERVPETDWDGLLTAVCDTPTGKAAADQYEKATEALLTALFYPDLNHPVHQPPLHEGRKRLDYKYTNMALSGFFEWLAKHFAAPQVFVECKNFSSDVANPELDQLSSRFGTSRGNFGILVCRGFDNKKLFLKRCRDTALDGRGFIIALDDDDLARLVESRKADSQKYREWALLRQQFDALIS